MRTVFLWMFRVSAWDLKHRKAICLIPVYFHSRTKAAALFASNFAWNASKITIVCRRIKFKLEVMLFTVPSYTPTPTPTHTPTHPTHPYTLAWKRYIWCIQTLQCIYTVKMAYNLTGISLSITWVPLLLCSYRPVHQEHHPLAILLNVRCVRAPVHVLSSLSLSGGDSLFCRQLLRLKFIFEFLWLNLNSHPTHTHERQPPNLCVRLDIVTWYNIFVGCAKVRYPHDIESVIINSETRSHPIAIIWLQMLIWEKTLRWL